MTQPSVSAPLTPVLCPKCGSQMLPVPRFGVEIDQCTGCGGIFLDRGELEQLAQAEAKFYAPPASPAPQYIPPQQYAQPTYPQGSQPGFLGGLFGGGSNDHHGRRRGHH